MHREGTNLWLTVPLGNGITVESTIPPMKTVKEMCALTGVSRKTLYYYDKIGILSPSRRIGKQKSKLYSDAAVKRLLLIKKYQEAGLTLEEIRRILENSDTEETVIREALSRMEREAETIRIQMGKARTLLQAKEE